MSRKKARLLAFLLIGAILCAGAFLFWRLHSRLPVQAQRVSPGGTYVLRAAWNRTEVWPHHAPPVDIELRGYQSDPEKRLFTLRSTIDNDLGDARMDEDIRIFWESDSRAVILLLGRLQTPEVITVDFGGAGAAAPEITRERSYAAARDVFQAHGIPLSDLTGLKGDTGHTE